MNNSDLNFIDGKRVRCMYYTWTSIFLVALT